jgi:sugar phosphate isomerase/epimerase
MRLGLGSYTWRWGIGIGDRRPVRPLTPADLVVRTAALGVRLLQIADNLPLHMADEATLESLVAAAAQHDVTLELGASGFAPTHLVRYADLAVRLDAKLVRIAPDGADAAKSDAALIADLNAALPAFKAAGAVLAVENHFHIPSPRLVRLIEAVGDPALGVCLDVANSIACEERPVETIALLAPYAVNLHLKDYAIEIDRHGVGMRFTGRPLGAGRLDIAAVFAALARHDRNVNVILEHWLPEAASPEATAALEAEWLAASVATARRHVPD